MTIEQTIEQIDALEAKATRGRWRVDEGYNGIVHGPMASDVVLMDDAAAQENIDLITALRNAWPAISEELRRLRRIERAFEGIIGKQLNVRLNADLGLWKVSDAVCTSLDHDLLTAIESALGKGEA